MGIMKLHLFQDIIYAGFADPCSWSDYTALLEALSTLVLRENSSMLNAEEFISAGTWDADSEFSLEKCIPAFFGVTCPAEHYPERLQPFILQAGDYLFSQFSDSSSRGITAAAEDARMELYHRNWNPSGNTVFLRGIREESLWKLQLLIHLI